MTFAAAHLLTLAFLLWRRYYRLCPVFCLAFTARTWQACVASMMRPGWSHQVWQPGEVVTLVLVIAAALEVAWMSTRRLETHWRILIFGTLLLGAAGVTGISVPRPLPADWFDWFVEVRSWSYLGLLVMAGCAAWTAWWVRIYVDHFWLVAARWHMHIYAALMGAHVFFGSGRMHWSANRLCFRITVCVCLAGWIWNSQFQAREQRSLKALRAEFMRSLSAVVRIGRQCVGLRGGGALGLGWFSQRGLRWLRR